MNKPNRKVNRRRDFVVRGSGLVSSTLRLLKKVPISAVVNRAIDALPIELHLPGYSYCGPGTKLKERLSRGDRGINRLDEACKEHDIAYSKFSDTEKRSIADRVLAEKAWQRVKSSDASLGERAASLAVTTAMRTKRAIGGGGSRKKKRCKRRTTKHGAGTKRRQRRTRKGNKRLTHSKNGRGLYLRPYKGRVY